MEIINKAEIPTYYGKKDNKLTPSVLDLSIASKSLINEYYEWDTLELLGSDHTAILSSFYVLKQQQQNTTQIRNSNNTKTAPKTKATIPKYKFYAPKDKEEYKKFVVEGTAKLYYQYNQEEEEKYDKNIIEKLSYEFYCLILEAAKKYIGISRINNNKKPWITREIILYCNKTQRMYNKWKKTGRNRFYYVYKQMKRQRNKLCKQAKEDYFNKTVDIINKCDPKWWQTINKIRGFNKNNNNKIPFLKDKNKPNIIIYDDKTKANKLNNFHCNKTGQNGYKPIDKMCLNNIPTAEPSYYPRHDIQTANKIQNKKLTKDIFFHQQQQKLNEKITTEEVTTAIKLFKTNKNQGPGIHIKLLLLVLDDIMYFLVWLFNLFFTNSYLPRIFKIRYIKPIIKPTKDPHILNNYRQISLFGSIGKIYEKILSLRLTKFVVDADLLNKQNMGFLQGKSAVDALAIITSDIYASFDEKIPTYAVLFDIVSCYDKIQYDILLARLQTYYGIIGLILKAISNLFESCWVRTIANNIGSYWLLSTAGLGQGRPI